MENCDKMQSSKYNAICQVVTIKKLFHNINVFSDTTFIILSRPPVGIKGHASM